MRGLHHLPPYVCAHYAKNKTVGNCGNQRTSRIQPDMARASYCAAWHAGNAALDGPQRNMSCAPCRMTHQRHADLVRLLASSLRRHACLESLRGEKRIERQASRGRCRPASPTAAAAWQWAPIIIVLLFLHRTPSCISSARRACTRRSPGAAAQAALAAARPPRHRRRRRWPAAGACV